MTQAASHNHHLIKGESAPTPAPRCRWRKHSASRGLATTPDFPAAEALAMLKEAAATFEWYGDLHAAKPDPDKAARNYELARRCQAVIAKAESGNLPANAEA